MKNSNLEAALDDVINKFKEDSSKSIEYCPEGLISSFSAITTATAEALESFKNIILYDMK